jgi:hypothetical protein
MRTRMVMNVRSWHQKVTSRQHDFVLVVLIERRKEVMKEGEGGVY